MNTLDPFYLMLRYGILRGFFKVELEKAEQEFIANNIRKHRKILWINLAVTILAILGLRENPDQIMTVISSLVGAVTITGVAWFSVSFGGIPAKLLDMAMSITFWMFSAFMASFTATMIAVIFAVPAILWPIFFLIYFGVTSCCIQYDTADGLKAGLDESVLNHSRAAILYYKKQGIDPSK